MKSLGTRALVVGVAGLALALSGCASGSIDGGSTPEETASGELTHVTYGLFPSSTVAAL